MPERKAHERYEYTLVADCVKLRSTRLQEASARFVNRKGGLVRNSGSAIIDTGESV
jgi:hypothetical protein